MVGCLLWLASTNLQAIAQNEPLPTEPGPFIQAFYERMGVVQNPEAITMRANVYNAWNSSSFTEEQRLKVIEQTQAIQKKGLAFWPEVASYLHIAIFAASPTAKIQVPISDFLGVMDTCLQTLDTPKLRNFLNLFGRFVISGEFYRADDYRIQFPPLLGRLHMVTMPDVLNSYPGSPPAMMTFPGFQVRESDVVMKFLSITGTIYQTNGLIDFGALKFYGNGGQYTWERTGLNKLEVYCDLKQYILSLEVRGIFADSVLFHNPKAGSGAPIEGRLEDNLAVAATPNELVMPAFGSYKANTVLKDIRSYLDYEGGYAMRGIHQYGASTKESDGVDTKITPARLYVKNGTRRIARIETSSIPLDDSVMRMSRVAATLFLENGDSLYHPSLSFSYYPERPQMLLYKDRRVNPLSAQPMESSFHHYNLFFEKLTWNPTEDSIILSALIDQEHRPAFFESQDYFRSNQYREFQGVLPGNPVGICYQYIMDRRKAEVAAYRKRYPVKKPDAGAASVPEEEPLPAADDWGGAFGDFNAPEPTFVTDANGYAVAVPATDSVPPPSYTPLNAPFTLTDIFTKYPQLKPYKEGFRQSMAAMQFASMVYYNGEFEEIVPRPALVRWGKAAAGKKDYDVVQLISYTEALPNGKIEVNTGTLTVNGIEEFILSDSQKVYIRPQNKSVRAYGDRDLQFGGLIYAGKANFWGKGTAKFFFDYSKFNIYCEKLDSVKFFPERDPSYDPRANQTLAKALKRLKIEDVVGSIYINQPTNKNGLKVDKKYPIFDCYTIAYVYWSDRFTQKSVYKRDKLFFALDPFMLDSLENFVIDNLEFQGEFECDSIIPTFRDTLKPVSDNTYGISENFPDGVPVYRGKGTFTNRIEMNAFGLWGKGKMDYLSTTALADTFIFHFDSCMALVKKFEVPEGNLGGVYFPKMEAGPIRYVWYPYQDRLVIQTLKTPIILHDGNAEFTGWVVITPKGAIGKGTLKSGQITLVGDSINLSTKEINITGGTFQVADPVDPKKVIFIAKNADTKFDVDKRTASFLTANPGTALLSFPQNKYETTLSEGTYNETTGDIALSTKYPDKQFNLMRSTAPDQFGLEFPASTAAYNTKVGELSVKGVDSILVADAVAYPDKGELRINPSGKLGLFENARLATDTADFYHHFVEAQLTIASRIQYKGSGKYPYHTQGVPTQFVEFANIRSLPDTTSFAEGEITEDPSFQISKRILYRGKVEMRAGKRFLGFEGEVKVEIEQLEDWLVFRDTLVNPDTVFVPINNPKNRAGRELTFGVHFVGGRRIFYSNFFVKKVAVTDKDIVLAKGGLTYDQATREFRVGPRPKIEGLVLRGTTVSFDGDLKIVTTRGRINFPSTFLQASDKTPNPPKLVQAAGSWRQELEQDKHPVNTRLLFKVDLPALPEDAQKEIARQFRTFAFDRADINYADPLLLQSAAEFLDTDSLLTNEPKARALEASIGRAVMQDEVKLSRELGGALVLTDLQLSYNDSVKGFWSSVPAGFSGLGGESVGKQVDTKIEYRVGRLLPDGLNTVNDTLTIYLSTDENSWVMFRMVNNTLSTWSSESVYNRMIEEAVGKQKDPGTPDVQVLARLEDIDVTRYLRKFSQYLYIR